MKQIKVITYCEDIVAGGEFRCEDDGLLLTSDIAIVPDVCTLYFLRVKPSEEGADMYDDLGLICDIIIPTDSIDINTLPPEAALTFAMWAAGTKVEPLATAV